MANTFTDLKFTILLNIALESFVNTIQAIRSFAINASPDASQRGDRVRVRFIPSASGPLDWYVNGMTYSVQDVQANGIEVALSNHKFVSWGLTDHEIAEQPQIELEEFARQKGFQLAKAVWQDILSQVTVANFPQHQIVTNGGTPNFIPTAFGVPDVVNLGLAADNLAWSEMGRAMILSAKLHSILRQDPSIQHYLNYGTDSVIRRGVIPSLDTFDAIYKSTVLPANVPYGFAVKPDAMLVAMRYLAPQPGNLYYKAMPVTDPETGLTFGYREFYDNYKAQRVSVIECVYGYAQGNPNALINLTSS